MNRSTSSIRTLLLAASTSCVLALSPLALAKDGHGQGRGPDIDKMAERLELTAEQKTEFTNIMTTNMEEGKTRREAMRAEREAHMNQVQEQLASVLTAEQLGKFESMTSKRDKKQHHHRRDNSANEE